MLLFVICKKTLVFVMTITDLSYRRNDLHLLFWELSFGNSGNKNKSIIPPIVATQKNNAHTLVHLSLHHVLLQNLFQKQFCGVL